MMMNLVGAIGLAVMSSFGGLQPKQSYGYSNVQDNYCEVSVVLDNFSSSASNYDRYSLDLNTFNLVNNTNISDTRNYYTQGDYLLVYSWYADSQYYFAFMVCGEHLYPQYYNNNNRLYYMVEVGSKTTASNKVDGFCVYNYDNGHIGMLPLYTSLEDWAYYDQSEDYYMVLNPYNTHDYAHGFRVMMDLDNEIYPFVSLYDYAYSFSYSANMVVEFKFTFGNQDINPSLVSSAYDDGYDDGYYEGESQGYSDGYQEGTQYGYDIGYDEGLYAGRSETHYSFTDLFGAIADTPILIVRNLFDFDLFGVNVLTIVMSLFTAMILFYLFRKLL